MHRTNANEETGLTPDAYVRLPGAAVARASDPHVRLDVFEGPISELLAFARGTRLDPSVLPLRDLTDQLAGFGREPDRHSLYDRTAAAALGAAVVAWKASGLLPPRTRKARSGSGTPRSGSVAKREALRRAARRLDALPRRGRDVFGPGRRGEGKAKRLGSGLSSRALDDAMGRMRARRRTDAGRSVVATPFTDADGAALLDRAIGKTNGSGAAVSLRALSAAAKA